MINLSKPQHVTTRHTKTGDPSLTLADVFLSLNDQTGKQGMTYSQIVYHVLHGNTVFFASERYNVTINNGVLYTTDIYNGWRIGLHHNEYAQCFVGEAT